MLDIPADIWENMIEHARSLDPRECCGMLAGRNGTVTKQYRITNILARLSEAELAQFDQAKLSDLTQLSPDERADIAFQMDAQELSQAQKDIRQQSIALTAFYHSHTHSPARPSVTDIKIAMEFESYRAALNLPEPLHVIISLEDKTNPIIRAYRIHDSRATEVPVKRRSPSRESRARSGHLLPEPP